MTILINDLARHSAGVGGEIRRAVENVVASGWYVLGKQLSMFEEVFAEYCGVEHCVGVANGTDALELSFRGLGIGPGTRVATVANAGFYTTTALNAVGAAAVFVDVDSVNHLMNLELLGALASDHRIDAIVVTHLFGLMHDTEAIRVIADTAGIPMIEDCAQAHGARRNGRHAGSSGDAACFSFYPTKNLGAIGDAGAILTNDTDLALRLVSLRQYGWEKKYRIGSAGGRNSRLDEIQAAVLRAKLPHLDGWNSRRREIGTRYSQGIRHDRINCPGIGGEEYVAHLYVITCDDREGLRGHLNAVGISSDVHYPVPDHLQPLMKDIRPQSRLPVTEDLAGRVLTLPCFPELTDAEVDEVIRQVNAWRPE